MKPLRFVCMPVYACLVLFLTSCGGGEKTSNTDTTATTTDTTANKTSVETSTIITTPQNMMVITHKVANYAKWKTSYDAHDSARLASGIHSYVIARGVQDSNMVMVAVKIDDMNKAKAFAKDPGLKKAMQQGGVTGTPSINFVVMTFQDTANINSDMRSKTTFKVKDWNTWQKNFEQGKQLRLDNGLTDRAYGHDADDDHKVTVVTAVVDSSKASAFWKSDTLKKVRAASGVMGEPQRFVYRIVQRY